jgi:hypothetical protein
MIIATAVAGCSPSSTAAPKPDAAATHNTAAKQSARAASAASAACAARKRGPQIYIRTSGPDAQAVASELGGEWTWDYVTSQCLDTLEDITATAGTAPGDCTTAGWVSDNPGYNYNAVPAPAIPDIVTEAGPACGS